MPAPKAADFTAEELAGAQALRARLGNDLPELFNTDFYLARWWRAYNGDLAKIDKYFHDYMMNRALLGYDADDMLYAINTLPVSSKVMRYFSVSVLDERCRSGDCCMFVQRMKGVDLKQMFKIMPVSMILHSYFGLQELFSRVMLDFEREKGRPANMTIILDVDGVNLSDFINPLGSCTKFAKLTSKIWQDYFSENIIKMYIVNPPGILSLMWQVAKCIMDQKSQSRVEFISKPEDLLLHLDASNIPAALGGTWTDTSGFADPPELCCNQAKTICSIDYPKAHQIWLDNGFKCPPPMIHGTIKAKHPFVVTRTVTQPGTRLVWEFAVNGDVDFDITRTDCANIHSQQDKEQQVWPRLTVQSLKMNEQGQLVCKQPGEYRLRFANANSTWFAIKLEYAVGLADDRL